MGTDHDLSRAIRLLSNEDPEWIDKAACMIKKHCHGVKMGVYHKIFLDIKYGPRKPKAFKKHVKRFVARWIPVKIETHKNFAAKSYRNQIYGLFDWKKTK